MAIVTFFQIRNLDPLFICTNYKVVNHFLTSTSIAGKKMHLLWPTSEWTYRFNKEEKHLKLQSSKDKMKKCIRGKWERLFVNEDLYRIVIKKLNNAVILSFFSLPKLYTYNVNSRRIVQYSLCCWCETCNDKFSMICV